MGRRLSISPGLDIYSIPVVENWSKIGQLMIRSRNGIWTPQPNYLTCENWETLPSIQKRLSGHSELDSVCLWSSWKKGNWLRHRESTLFLGKCSAPLDQVVFDLLPTKWSKESFDLICISCPCHDVQSCLALICGCINWNPQLWLSGVGDGDYFGAEYLGLWLLAWWWNDLRYVPPVKAQLVANGGRHLRLPPMIACPPSAIKFIFQQDKGFPYRWPNNDLVARSSIIAAPLAEHSRLRRFLSKVINEPKGLQGTVLSIPIPNHLLSLESWAQQGEVRVTK